MDKTSTTCVNKEKLSQPSLMTVVKNALTAVNESLTVAKEAFKMLLKILSTTAST